MTKGGGHLAHDWYPEALPDNVVVGERSWLYSSFAFLHYRSERPLGLRIGSDTGVYYTTFFELGPEGEVDIGDFCSIVGAIINVNCRVEIHDFAFVAHDVVITDSPWAVPPEGRGPPPDVPTGSRPIVLGENSWIGARALLPAGTSVGAGAIVGAGSVVGFDVPAHTVVAGNPARVVGRAPG